MPRAHRSPLRRRVAAREPAVAERVQRPGEAARGLLERERAPAAAAGRVDPALERHAGREVERRAVGDRDPVVAAVEVERAAEAARGRARGPLSVPGVAVAGRVGGGRAGGLVEAPGADQAGRGRDDRERDRHGPLAASAPETAPCPGRCRARARSGRGERDRRRGGRRSWARRSATARGRSAVNASVPPPALVTASVAVTGRPPWVAASATEAGATASARRERRARAVTRAPDTGPSL